MSGIHQDYDDNLKKKITVIDKPFHCFVKKNSTLKDLHCFMEKHPGLFETLVGTLPVGVYTSSVDDQSANETAKLPTSASKITCPVNGELVAYNRIQEIRNSILDKKAKAVQVQSKALFQSSLIEDLKNLQDMLNKSLDKKRNLKQELESKVPDPSDCKQCKKEHNHRVQFPKLLVMKLKVMTQLNQKSI